MMAQQRRAHQQLRGFASALLVPRGRPCCRGCTPQQTCSRFTPATPFAVAETMVQMECNYVTPSFFRELEQEYQSGLKSEDEGLEGAAEPEDRMAQLARGACALARPPARARAPRCLRGACLCALAGSAGAGRLALHQAAAVLFCCSCACVCGVVVRRRARGRWRRV